MLKMKTVLAGASAAIAVAAAATAEAAVVVNLTPAYPGAVTGSVPYSLNEVLRFTFTINPPFHFIFTATGDGGTFPFPISELLSGAAGTYTETYGPLPVRGTVDYSLVTAVPEASAWVLMLVGSGLAGLAARRRRARGAPA